ncbi:unnamed protein product [Calypogeia fissa]
MCAPIGKFEPPNFSESYEDVKLPEVFNVTLPMHEDEDEKFEDQKTVEGDYALPTFTDDQFKAVLEETIHKKRPLAKRKSKAEKGTEVAQAVEDKAKPFQKQVVVKVTTQEWLERAAKEHLERKKNARRNKLKTTVNSDGTTLAAVEPKKRRARQQTVPGTDNALTKPKRGRKPTADQENMTKEDGLQVGGKFGLNGPPRRD